MKTILLIDDSEADQFIGDRIITQAYPNVKIIKAMDGQEALDLMAEHNIVPDVILLDINMPRIRGHDFLAKFTNNNTREIPVIVMLTSSDQEQDKAQTTHYKCVKDYFLKPLRKACGVGRDC